MSTLRKGPRRAPRPGPQPWEFCEGCGTDLRDWEHEQGCAGLRSLVDWAHANALTYHCQGCGYDWRDAGPHPEKCEAEKQRLAKFSARCQAGLEASWVGPPLHWPPLPLVQHPAFGEWLERCQGWGFAHGVELADALIASGTSADSADADALLVMAMELDWVRATTPQPTPSQRFFAVNRFSPPPPCWYGYVPGFCRTRRRVH